MQGIKIDSLANTNVLRGIFQIKHAIELKKDVIEECLSFFITAYDIRK